MLWQSLIATVNEQAKALQRAAFSPIVREAGDLANAVFDRRGRMVAQAVTGTPGHINSLAIGAAATSSTSTRPTRSGPGDVLITNDPYKTAGQLLDVTVLVPGVHATGGSIAFFGSTIHHTDVGGYGIGAGGRDVFEEGLWIPICKLHVAGRAQPGRLEVHPLQRAPARPHGRRPPRPDGVRRGRRAAAAGAAATPARPRRHRGPGRRDHRALGGGHPGARSARCRPAPYRATRRARPRRRQPRSTSTCAHHRRRRGRRDRSSTTRARPGASPYGINVVKNYTHAYTTFTVRSRAQPRDPEQPRQPGADQGRGARGHRSSTPCRPQPCTARHVVGMFLPNALAQGAGPGQARAGDGRGLGRGVDHAGQRPRTTTAARSSRRCSPTPAASAPGPRKPGLSACSYPTGVAAVPVEVVEASRTDPLPPQGSCGPGSGGAGAQTRRARARRSSSPSTPTRPWQLNAVTQPPRGAAGGDLRRRPGRGRPFSRQRRAGHARRPGSRWQPGDVVRLELPGGGGYGAAERADRPSECRPSDAE